MATATDSFLGSNPETSGADTTPKNSSSPELILLQSAEDAIYAGFDALNNLGRGNFTSGVHYCPPHYVDHAFFTKEMAVEYDRNFSDGPLRDYSGKIWQELTYHALKDNLEKLLVSEPIFKCMWVFSGLNFVDNVPLLKQLSIDTKRATEIDHLVCCLTETNKVLLVPIEVKRVGKDDRNTIEKAEAQCKRNSECLQQLLHKLLSQNVSETDIGKSVQPCVFLCHDDNEVVSIENTSRQNTSAKKFNLYLHYQELTNFGGNESNFFAVLLSMPSENKLATCSPEKYQQIVCLLATILSCHYKSKNKHDETTCLKHFTVARKEVCMKGTMLCPKYIHEYVVSNVDFLKYLRSFRKTGVEPSPNTFNAYSINNLKPGIRKYAKMFLVNLTNEQLLVLQSEEKRVLIYGDYGGGKTLALSFKAMDILETILTGRESGQIYFVSTRNALDIDVIPKFEKAFSRKICEKHVRFLSWDDVSGIEILPSEGFWFLDEFDECLLTTFPERLSGNVVTGLNVVTDEKLPLVWVVIASNFSRLSHDIEKRRPELHQYQYVPYCLSWQLRNSQCVSYFYSIVEGKNRSSLDYPIYGVPPRIYPIGPKDDNQKPPETISLLINEVEYWLSQMEKGSIMILLCDSKNFQEKVNDLKKELQASLQEKFSICFQDLSSRVGTITHRSRNFRGYISTEPFGDDDFTGLEFDVVVVLGSCIYNYEWKVYSRAKYGISSLHDRRLDPNGDRYNRYKTLQRWGRYSAINV